MTHNTPTHKRALTSEEAELWQHAMRQAKALRRRGRDHAQDAVHADATQDASPGPSAGAAGAKAAQQPPAAKPPAPAPSFTVLPQPPKPPPPLSDFDERQRRKIARDTGMIDARLDLHGMRQREAHGELIMFLRGCAARGMRNVLVITGKGRSAADELRERDFYREERGVLRRLVPEWLAGTELRGIVVSYTASHVRHGGEGALYVRLRKVSPSR